MERTVKDVVPALSTNREGVSRAHIRAYILFLTTRMQIRKVISNLVEQYKTKEEDFDTFKRDYGIRPVSNS